RLFCSSTSLIFADATCVIVTPTVEPPGHLTSSVSDAPAAEQSRRTLLAKAVTNRGRATAPRADGCGWAPRTPLACGAWPARIAPATATAGPPRKLTCGRSPRRTRARVTVSRLRLEPPLACLRRGAYC